MTKSVKTNLLLNTIYTISQVFFPLITFPYASRIMGPTGIGQVNFYNSIISYIILFTSLGIPMYAIREVAKVRCDIVKMNRTVMEIFLLSSFLTFWGYVAVAIISIFVPEVHSNVSLFLVLSSTLLFDAIGCNWFYAGIEDFFYITIRGLAFKIISIFFLFYFVHDKQDLLLYGIYYILSSVGSNVFNFVRLRKYIHKENFIFSELRPFRHLRASLEIFALNIITSIYLQLNTVMLGFYYGNEAVGLYSAATKLMYVVLMISNSLGPVIMPRVTNLIAEGKTDDFMKIIQKAYNFSYALTLPLSIGLFFVSPYAVRILCGTEFEPAITAARIVSPIIFIVSFSGFMGTQTLYPMGKVKIIIACTAIGAAIDLLINILLMPSLSFNAAAISYLGAETATSLSMYLIAHKMIPVKFINTDVIMYTISAIIMGAGLFLISFLHMGDIAQLITMLIIGSAIYLGILLWKRDKFAIEVLEVLKSNMLIKSFRFDH